MVEEHACRQNTHTHKNNENKKMKYKMSTCSMIVESVSSGHLYPVPQHWIFLKFFELPTSFAGSDCETQTKELMPHIGLVGMKCPWIGGVSEPEVLSQDIVLENLRFGDFCNGLEPVLTIWYYFRCDHS